MEVRGGAGARRRLNEIQAQLLSARHATGLTQQALSERLGVATRTLRNWEKSYDTPSLKHLISWARALGFRLVIGDSHNGAEPTPAVLAEGETFEVHELRRLTEPLGARRRAGNLSQVDLALLLGVSRSSMQRWEEAEKFPQPVALIAWANRLECIVELNQATNSGANPRPPAGDEAG